MAAALLFATLGLLPHLRIDPSAISCSGISSGADFAVQLHIAFSKTIMGVGVYAGQAYHCAVTRFPDDVLQHCADQPSTQQGPGCTSHSAPCDGCPPNTTLQYDHCKNFPERTKPAMLAAYAQQQSQLQHIDDVSNVARARVYLYRGTNDTVYLPGSVQAVGDVYEELGVPASRILFEKSVPSLHAMPTLDYGSPCGVPSVYAIEACAYDGAGAALQHIYSNTLRPRSTRGFDASNIFMFDQRPYFPAAAWPGLADEGYIYVPPQCIAGHVLCRLHVVLHGCTLYANNPKVNTTYVLHAGYNEWAATNDLVVLYPQGGGYPEHHRSGTAQQDTGCWDGYGQQPGPVDAADYATRTGVQAQTVWNMVQALAF